MAGKVIYPLFCLLLILSLSAAAHKSTGQAWSDLVGKKLVKSRKNSGKTMARGRQTAAKDVGE